MLSGLGAAFHSTAVANAGNHLTSNIAIAWLSVVVMLIVIRGHWRIQLLRPGG